MKKTLALLLAIAATQAIAQRTMDVYNWVLTQG